LINIFIFRVRPEVPRLLINREKAGEANAFMRAMGLSQGMDFTSKESRDVAWLGDCDEGCNALAASFGWAVSYLTINSKLGNFMFFIQDELKSIHETEHKGIDKVKEDEKTNEKTE
jgi:hypothetical protein